MSVFAICIAHHVCTKVMSKSGQYLLTCFLYWKGEFDQAQWIGKGTGRD